MVILSYKYGNVKKRNRLIVLQISGLRDTVIGRKRLHLYKEAYMIRLIIWRKLFVRRLPGILFFEIILLSVTGIRIGNY